MDLTFNLETGAVVELDREPVNLAGAKELYIDGLVTSDVSLVLKQLWTQYRDLGTDDVIAADIAAALRIGITATEPTEVPQIIANDLELDNFVRKTTIGELLNGLDRLVAYNPSDQKMAKSFEKVLAWGADLYEDLDDDICFAALLLARTVVRARDAIDYIDKSTAKEIAGTMAILADDMLKVGGAGEWDFGTLVSLKKIRRSDPELAEREQKQGGPVMSNGKTQAEIDAQIVF